MPKYVIVGASAAGIGAVEAIREVDHVGTITVISDEECPQYSRPMISDLVSGKADLNTSPVERLSDRELEVFQLIGKGFGTRQISERLFLSIKTIESSLSTT